MWVHKAKWASVSVGGHRNYQETGWSLAVSRQGYPQIAHHQSWPGGRAWYDNKEAEQKARAKGILTTITSFMFCLHYLFFYWRAAAAD